MAILEPVTECRIAKPFERFNGRTFAFQSCELFHPAHCRGITFRKSVHKFYSAAKIVYKKLLQNVCSEISVFYILGLFRNWRLPRCTFLVKVENPSCSCFGQPFQKANPRSRLLEKASKTAYHFVRFSFRLSGDGNRPLPAHGAKYTLFQTFCKGSESSQKQPKTRKFVLFYRSRGSTSPAQKPLELTVHLFDEYPVQLPFTLAA